MVRRVPGIGIELSSSHASQVRRSRTCQVRRRWSIPGCNQSCKPGSDPDSGRKFRNALRAFARPRLKQEVRAVDDLEFEALEASAEPLRCASRDEAVLAGLKVKARHVEPRLSPRVTRPDKRQAARKDLRRHRCKCFAQEIQLRDRRIRAEAKLAQQKRRSV